MADTPTDPPSFEAARDELVEIVQKLEAGGVTLEESIRLWERGEQLAAICQRWLDGARARLDEVVGAHDSDPARPRRDDA
jgi:exodeoxyribonuclease VII small subunit